MAQNHWLSIAIVEQSTKDHKDLFENINITVLDVDFKTFQKK